jgi:tRNA 2-thiouridine synthesizing protein A
MAVLIDARGLQCPLPILRVRKMMREVAPGASVEILATDPGTEQDLHAYCDAVGADFLSSRKESGGVFRFLIRKAG